MTPEQHRRRMEEALADAAMLGDQAAMAKHGIALRTLKGYRTRARRDASLARASIKKVEQAQSLDWLRTAEQALDDMTTAVRDVVVKMSSKRSHTPAELHSMAGVIKILSEASLARVMLEFKLKPQGTTASLVTKDRQT